MSWSLLHSPADIVATSIISGGHATAHTAMDEWPLFVSHLPPEDIGTVHVNAVAVYDTTGRQDGRNQKTGEQYEHPGIQVRVRSVDHATGDAKIRAISKYLDGLLRSSVSKGVTNYEIQSITRTTNVIALGVMDDTRRYSFTVNAVCAISAV